MGASGVRCEVTRPPPLPSALPSGTGWAGSLRLGGHQPPGGSRGPGRGLFWLPPQLSLWILAASALQAASTLSLALEAM